MFVIVVGVGGAVTPSVVGPFPHKEGAESYAKANSGWHLYHIVQLEAPTETVTTTKPLGT